VLSWPLFNDKTWLTAHLLLFISESVEFLSMPALDINDKSFSLITVMSDGASPSYSSSSIDEDLPFAISESFVPTRDRKEAALTEVTVNGLLEKPLLLTEDLKEGCGGQLWPAGMLLSDYMLREHRSDLRGKTMSVS
jgi:hypothetical protein